MIFRPNKRFRKDYNKLFKQDPLAANTLLLLAELANEKGQIVIEGSNELEVAEEIQRLLIARFNNPEEYAL